MHAAGHAIKSAAPASALPQFGISLPEKFMK